MKTARYFKDAEFKRCTPSCSIEDMDQSTLDMLDRLREKTGIPLKLNCAYRSKAHDIKMGRSGNSSHTKGKGVDIACNASDTRFKILSAAYALGIRRIGIGKTFIHIDNDTSLPQDVVWHYYN